MAARARLDESGFIEFVARLVAGRRGAPAGAADPRVVLGIGDDAAVLRWPGAADLLLTTDLLTEGVHFRKEYTPGLLLGRKSLAVNLSDIAAMGGVPRACVFSVGFPRDTRVEYARAVARGLADQARSHGVVVVGGDTCAAGRLFACVALLGTVRRNGAVRRAGARPGDGLFVTGHLGAAAAGLELLTSRRRVGRRGAGRRRAGGGRRAGAARVAAAERLVIRAHLDPVPRVLVGRLLGESGVARAMIDLSDGLVQDLPRLCTMSGVGAVVEEEAVPVAPAALAVVGPGRARAGALSGGEDYELLFAARDEDTPALARLARRTGLPITRIGQIVPRRAGVRLLTGAGRYQPFAGRPRGFEHFRH